MAPPRWLFLEPYYGGSHRHLVDLLCAQLPLDAALWTLPPRKWKWRMRAAAVHFAQRWANERPRADGIFVSSLLNVAELRGLLPPEARNLPLVLYFHENQFHYPVQVHDERDFHFGWANALSAASADVVLWNSAYNRDSFLAELARVLALVPDARSGQLPATIRERSRVLPVPLAPEQATPAAGRPQTRPIPERAAARAGRTGPCRILWNHRWEHDKGPEEFFGALIELAATGLSFELSVLGQSFAELPAVFETARQALAGQIRVWGYLESGADYAAELARCDTAVSTARHEFQGLAMLEAARCGAVPLVPDDLVYPEIWPPHYRYARGELRRALRARILDVTDWRSERPGDYSAPFAWERLAPQWAAIFGLAL